MYHGYTAVACAMDAEWTNCSGQCHTIACNIQFEQPTQQAMYTTLVSVIVYVCMYSHDIVQQKKQIVQIVQIVSNKAHTMHLCGTCSTQRSVMQQTTGTDGTRRSTAERFTRNQNYLLSSDKRAVKMGYTNTTPMSPH